jgi:hypothetical protein
MLAEWKKRWEDFINAIVDASGPGKQIPNAQKLKRVAEKAERTRLAQIGNANGKTSKASAQSS